MEDSESKYVKMNEAEDRSHLWFYGRVAELESMKLAMDDNDMNLSARS